MSKRKTAQLKVEFSTQTIQGLDAIELLEDPAFKKSWEGLLDEYQYASVFQHASFVLPWYRLNLEEFSPVVLLAYADQKLVGLLTLARKIDAQTGKYCRKLIGAGSFFALYQTWVVLPEYLGQFWDKGMKSLWQEIPGCSINLKSLPDKRIYHEMSIGRGFKRVSVLEKHLNPVLDYESENYQQIFGKRHFRSKFNRLNRAGEAIFEKITSIDDLKSAMETIEVFHNLRQGAAFNKTPFIQSNHQKELFWEWFDKGVLHVTALRFNQELIAAVLIVNDFGATAHLAGLITYSPKHAKLSPGLVHLYLLGQMLRKESFQNLKLSPGDDAYKERFSNTHEELFEILISPKWSERIFRKIRVKARVMMLNNGIRPMEVHVWLSKKKASLKNKWYWFWHQSKNLHLSTDLILDKLKLVSKSIHVKAEINLNSSKISDLLLLEDTCFEVSKWQFLEDALKRLENHESCLTYVRDGRLRLCIWYVGKINSVIELDELFRKDKIKKIYISRYFTL
ncbi:GNAT family N-acetyltransferase [Aquiflexum lacus]|uniref:GNAT family N-acetyltransferase n=1 Tax=Aquiflexum lacus TaxID=2483805 RepID=UPI001895AD28|nr:GNAT family N-acetyltransferase [Aquiflexum lacus]